MSKRRLADKQHRWLSLLEISGVVLSEPILADAAPAGFRVLERSELASFYKARETWLLPPGMLTDPDGFWTEYVLGKILELQPKYWTIGASITKEFSVDLSAHKETLRPTRVLFDQKEPVMLFLQVPRSQSLDSTWVTNGGWKASPTTKLDRLLRSTGVEVGLLTNGESWRLIVSSPSQTMSHMTWTSQTWADSPVTLAAFKELLGASRFFAGPKSGTILSLVQQSRDCQLEVADQLGHQARQSLDLFIREIDRIDAEHAESFLTKFSEDQLFESAVAFIMRLLFLFYAEENGLLPHGNVTYDTAYGIIHLLHDLERRHRISPESLSRSSEAYARLLGLFRLIYSGSTDPDIHVLAHGGTLFDPDRFPILEGASCPALSPPPVSDHTIRNILRSLKYAEGEGRAKQWVSYRSLAVEQIGFMYEGLLDRKLTRAEEPLAMLVSSDKDAQPIIALTKLIGATEDELHDQLAKLTGRKKTAIAKLLQPKDETNRPFDFGTTDPELLSVVMPIRPLLKQGGVVRKHGLYLTYGPDRHSTGTHYTPPQLTEPIVRCTLEPLTHTDKNVKSARELLEIRVCDVTMGSGAFLVQAVRYLADCIVSAWDQALANNPGIPLSMPYAEPAIGRPEEHILPGSGPAASNVDDTRADMQIWAKRYVLEHCIFGADINHLAVEMAKLSLWLDTLSKGRPFTFLDHALKCGDSLIGIDDAQLATWSIEKTTGSQLNLFNEHARSIIDQVITLREEIANSPVLSWRDAKNKAKKLEQAESAIAVLKLGADLLTASHFCADSPKEREALRDKFLLAYMPLLQSWHSRTKKTEQDFSERYEKLRSECDEKLGTKTPFHWCFEFPEVFMKDKLYKGFSAIIGNPPFGNAIESDTARSNTEKLWYEAIYPEVAQGAFDKVNLFAAKSIYVLRQKDGRYGLMMTRANLSAGASSNLQEYINEVGRPSDIFLPSSARLFKGAHVYVCAIVGQLAKQPHHIRCHELRDEDIVFTAADKPYRDDAETWWAVIKGQARNKNCTLIKLKAITDDFEIFAGCATGAAYDLAPLVADSREGNALRLVITGLIDRYTFTWGLESAKYLKSSYTYPRWPDDSSAPNSVKRAAQRQRKPKLLLGGLTKTLEAALDMDGNYGGVVSTWAIAAKKNCTPEEMQMLEVIVNSYIVSYRYSEEFGAKQSPWGGMTIQKAGLERISYPDDLLQIEPPTKEAQTISSVWELDQNDAASRKLVLQAVWLASSAISSSRAAGRLDTVYDIDGKIQASISWLFGLSEEQHKQVADWFIPRDRLDKPSVVAAI